MSIEQIITTALPIVSGVVGIVAGYLAPKLSDDRKKYTPSNAIELLKMGKPEVWNEVRFTNSDWTPILDSIDLSRAFLQGVNFKDAIIKNCKLCESDLEGASFERSKISGSDFTNSNIKNSTFLDAEMQSVSFDGANATNAEFQGVNIDVLQSYRVKNDRDDNESGESIEDMSPHDFELLVAKLMDDFGYFVDSDIPNSDRGFDLLLSPKDPVLGGSKYLLEVKRYSKNNKVSSSTIRELLGAIVMNDADGGVVVTNSSFTTDAINFAKHNRNLRLIDGTLLKQMIAEHNAKIEPNKIIQQTP